MTEVPHGKLAYEIVAPAGRIAQGECDMVIAPAVDGEVGILPKHAPYLAALAIGVVRIKNGDREDRIFVSNGFIEVYDNKVIILAEIAERAADIDVERAHRAEERARSHLAHFAATTGETPHDIARARRALTRAKERQRAAKAG